MTTKYQTKVLTCVDCKEEFAFTVDAQEYCAERGWKDDPKRCKSCHVKYKKADRNGHK